MQIHLLIEDYPFDKDLKERINKVEQLNQYIHILPCRILVNVSSDCGLSFFEKLFTKFNNPIISFNEVWCYGSVTDAISISDKAKKINI